MSDFLQFLKSKLFIINLLVAIILIFAVLLFIYNRLDTYTKHGESITVPDLKGLAPEKVKEFLDNKHLRYLIVDSMFDTKSPKGTVIDQDPVPNAKVKENRTVYLTLNSSLPPRVKMPNLLDVSYRQAEAILQTYGLKTGELIYKPDLAKNAVLGQQYKEREIKQGTEIPKGAVIDLILGDGLGNTQTPVPNLINLPLIEALSVLKGLYLNKGAVVADASVKDSLAAIVYKQIPAFTPDATINPGEPIDLFITQSPAKLPKDSVK